MSPILIHYQMNHSSLSPTPTPCLSESHSNSEKVGSYFVPSIYLIVQFHYSCAVASELLTCTLMRNDFINLSTVLMCSFFCFQFYGFHSFPNLLSYSTSSVIIKLISFCTAKETIKKKRQPKEREKIVSNDSTDKALIYKIYKQLIQLNSKKTQQSN